MSSRPGTVSKILWHFTGGPLWDSVEQKQKKELKPAMAGYNALKSILSSSELRLGSYREVVKVILPQRKKYNLKTKKIEVIKNFPVRIESSSVCCVADIPLQHLSYHANRYGKIAIGFKREAIVRAGFNPVMYTLENTELLNSIYKGHSSIDDLDTSDSRSELDDLEMEVNSEFEKGDIDEIVDISSVEMALDSIDIAKDSVEESYGDLLAHIKTFDESEFESIYCEREWRSTSPFKFSVKDIAMIVLPRLQEGFEFYDDFLASTSLPRNVTIAVWEDLIEH